MKWYQARAYQWSLQFFKIYQCFNKEKTFIQQSMKKWEKIGTLFYKRLFYKTLPLVLKWSFNFFILPAHSQCKVQSLNLLLVVVLCSAYIN